MTSSRDKAKHESEVSKTVINRLPRYYRCLRELVKKDILRISSDGLAKLLNTTASQIRQDFNCFGEFGQQGYGYNVKFLYTRIGIILGITDNYTAVIIGAGNLGMAIASDDIFARRGVILKAIFDIDSAITGTLVAGYCVKPISEIEAFCTENKIDIAVLTVGGNYIECLPSLNFKGIWNYTNNELNFDKYGIPVQNVYLGDTLMMLCYNIKQKDEIVNEN